MVRIILAPLDGSEFAEEALPLVRAIAGRVGAEVHLVHVVVPEPDVDFKTPQEDLAWREQVRAGAERYLTEMAAAAGEEGVSALTAVLEGRVADALLDYAGEQEVDLIALTSHGAGGVRRWWLGSVADALLREGATDLLLVPPWDDTEDRPAGQARFSRILVALDGSAQAEAALPSAIDLASRFAATLVAVRIVPSPMELTSIYGVPGVRMSGDGHRTRVEEATEYLAKVAQRTGAVPIETHVLESGGAAEGVVEGARALEADLIVLSSRGQGGLERAVLGSVADKVIRGTTRPILIVRSSASASKG